MLSCGQISRALDQQGRPSYTHWKDLFLETWSCSVRGYEQKGWMHSSEAEILLWCQCSLNEDWLDCFPYPFSRLELCGKLGDDGMR